MRILFICITFFSILSAIEFTPAEQEWIKNNPIVTYVGDPEWLPYEGYDENGKYIGLVPDVLSLVSKKLPFNFKHIDTKTWEESIEAVNNSHVMMISQSKYSNQRTGFDFTQTYFNNPIVFVMQKGESYVSSLHQVDTKRIGLINNKTTSPLFQKNYPHINFTFYDNAHKGLDALSLGQIDVFLCSLPRAGYEIAKNRLLNLRIVGKSEMESDLGFGVKDSPLLLSILNKVITETSENEVQDVLAKWSRQKYVEKVDHTLLYTSIAIFSFIILLILGFYLRLKHESQKRLAVQAKMLEQQAKMASMGEMMDAVAHQWKQPLNALSMYGDLMKVDFDEGRVDKAYVEEMLAGVNTQIEHMIMTLGEFRNFFRPNSSVVEFNLLHLVNSVLLLVKDEFLKNAINIESHIDEEMVLNGNENEFKHLILNIINNAKDAFNEKEIENRLITIRAIHKKEYLVLSIEDNAGGIKENIIASIFEAHVTTKEKGKGTGIGLYMSAQIVQKMKGSIEVENYRVGARFNIELPLT